MKKKIYIAGKVTGEDRNECGIKFANAQKEIEALGFEVVNPLKVVGDWNATWELAMRKCIAALMDCEAIVLLPDWISSPGAEHERHLASTVGIKIFNYSEFGLVALKKNLWNN